MNELVLDLQAELQELAAIEAESIGWLPLGQGAHLHVGVGGVVQRFLSRLLKKSVTPQDVVTTPQLELLHVVG